jgi:CDP-diglyceride synthetase
VLAQRLLSALVGIPALVGLIAWGPPWLFTGLVLLLALIAQLEL